MPTTPVTTKLRDRLRKLETLHAGATTPGEREAADAGRQRMLRRLAAMGQADPPVEYRFTFDNQWSRSLFCALLRRYGLTPFRYIGQRFTTVMVNVPCSFVDEVLWPEYLALNEAPVGQLDALAEAAIGEAVHGDASEAEERSEPRALEG